MLTYDVLIEQAKQRGMPATKIRGILREYLQIIILKEISRLTSGKKLYFTGGTYLRLLHNIRRFSEDLYFNSSRVAKKDFEAILKKVGIELKRSGVDTGIEFSHWDNMLAASLIFPTLEKAYNATSAYSKKNGIVIKVETYRTPWKIKSETRVISGFGELYPCVTTQEGQLFADKIDALTKKERGRHLYDIIFMLGNNFPIDKNVLKSLGIKEDPLSVILRRLKDFSKDELKRQAQILRPFLFEESEAELIVNAPAIVADLARKYSQTNAIKNK